ncbi:uncharacterized protein CTRU02_214953 [Colletotrichum truncatum]|uniref:Uncharacterized protein n=1 Tax=Colletotrichum truncatum TaxID=5467 RepID=A0ACC3YE76_COLTU|nr:uncharacterized protein CTRU02_08294 [Colletotrichum truncatum]KAF6790165.1 hypothetical protein CTRU02_08294 [Colletotrichum truncatum]
MTRPSRDGLVWKEGGFDPEPCWTREPSVEAIEKVCRRQLGIDISASCQVSFYASGAFNKLYSVHYDNSKLLMRVSLPVDPGAKTRGEVATLRWLQRCTNTPVPRVIAFDDTNSNEIGFEWILMEFMPGVSAYKRWRGMSMAQKTAFVEQVADLQSQIFHHESDEFQGIGTLQSSGTGNLEQQTQNDISPGRMVSLLLFWGEHYEYDIARGPFRSSHDWLESYLKVATRDYTKALREAEDEEDREDAEVAIQVAEKLLALLPKIFPVIQQPPERTFLWHDDLSLQNILVDDDGNITAVLDWECASTMPSWVTTQVPKFLDGARREEEPVRDQYGDDNESDSDSDLDNEGKNELYWIHLLEYEQTQLRKVYSDRMQKSTSEWTMKVQDSCLKTDFLEAVHRCSGGFYLKRIAQWADAITNGVFPRLAETLQTGRL